MTSPPALQLSLTREEAELLLDLVQQHADAHEFNPDASAQSTAYDGWVLAGRISDLLVGPEAGM